jgi:hypothetical protein
MNVNQIQKVINRLHLTINFFNCGTKLRPIFDIDKFLMYLFVFFQEIVLFQ